MNSHKFEIYFVLASRFPTNKAYGVTTENTARAATELGHRSTIITPELGEKDFSSLNVLIVGSSIRKYLLSRRIKKLIRFRFYIFLYFFSIFVTVKTKGENKIIWTRDILLAQFVSIFSNNRIVLEIHHKPNKIQSVYLKMISKNQKVIIAPISNFLDNITYFDVNRFVHVPMSINKSELIENYLISARSDRLIYLGSPESAGKEINFSFLNNLGFLLEKQHPNWKIEIIGFDKNFFSRRINDDVSSSLNFRGYLPRSIVLNNIKQAKIGLVIYEDDNYHQFPIKIVEYAASGLAILASDTNSHKRILDDSNCVFFKGDSVESAFRELNLLICNSSKIAYHAVKAREWVNDLTYENRVKRVIKKLIID